MLSQSHHQLQQQQPQYHYITTTGDDGHTPVFENYNNRTGNCIEIETPTTTIIKFETDDNNYEVFEIVRSTAAPSTDNSDSNSITTTADITTTLPATTSTTTTSTSSSKKAPKRRHTYAQHQLQMKQEQEMQQQQQQSGESYEFISNSDDANNQALSSGNESLLMVPKIPSVKQKRKRKTRIVTGDEQGEYLEKMSVRGLDIQRYEHIIDSVSYCLVCVKKDIYKTFKNKYSFQRHAYLFHEGENRKIFACPICNKEFSRPDKMKMHKKDKHGDMPVPDSTNNNVGTDASGNKNNGATVTKRARNVNAATRTPRAKRKRANGETQSTAKKKRLAQIDRVLDEVQNADLNASTNNSPQQQQLTQQLPSIDLNGMILPGGAKLALANPNTPGYNRAPLLQATGTFISSNILGLRKKYIFNI